MSCTYVFVSNDSSRHTAFSELNCYSNLDETLPQLGFYHPVESPYRIIRNRTQENTTDAFAIGRVFVDSTLSNQPPQYFRTIDFTLLTQALKTHEYVFFGMISRDHIIPPGDILDKVTYFARQPDGKIIDLVTNEIVDSSHVLFATILFSIVKVGALSVYWILLNPLLTDVGDGFGYRQSDPNVVWELIDQKDKGLRYALFAPTISGGSLFLDDQVIVAQTSEISIEFFAPFQSVFQKQDIVDSIVEDMWKVSSTLNYTYSNGTFTFELLPGMLVNTIEIEFISGSFFSEAPHPIRPIFKYIVLQNEIK